jgi:hypothetical protein
MGFKGGTSPVTWLFTQVWLWSLAAFMLGSLITWLLFVRPAKRQLRALMAEYSEYVEYAEQGMVDVAPGDVDPALASGQTERMAALDLLDPPEWEQPEAGPDEPTFGDWDRRTPLVWSAPNSGPANRAEPEPDVHQVQHIEQAHPFPEAAQADVEPVTFAGIQPIDRTADDYDWAAGAPEPQPAAEPEQHVEPPEQDVVAVDDFDQAVSERSTWFQKVNVGPQRESSEWSGTLDPSSSEQEREDAEAELSGRLRSLFEPASTPSTDQQAPYVDQQTPYVPPSSTDTAQSAAYVDEPVLDLDETPLPRRTLGAGTRPGAQNLNGSARREADASDPDHERRRAGSMIKGHFASGQYHTPDSPHYERIVAEVWFHTAQDAEEAGFEPWDGRTPN